MAATRHAQEVRKDTRDCITTALMQLLKTDSLSALTVSRVCTRAGVSRMAFYRNYRDLEQVLHEYYQPEISAVFEIIRKNPQFQQKYDSQLRFFSLFGKELVASIEHGFESIIQGIFLEETSRFYAEEGDEYLTAFMSAGTYAIWRKWLLEGQQKPLREIMTMLKRMNDAKN